MENASLASRFYSPLDAETSTSSPRFSFHVMRGDCAHAKAVDNAGAASKLAEMPFEEGMSGAH